MRHQVAEIPPVRPDVDEYRLHRLTCSCCGVITRAELPDGVATGPFGPRLRAILALFAGSYRLAKRPIQQLASDLTGLDISLGTVPKPERQAAAVLEPVVAEVAAVTAGLGRGSWQASRVREGAKGPLAFEFAAVRAWAVRHGAAGPPVWLLVRRSLEPVPEVKYYVSNADASTPLGGLAEVACARHAVEDYFEDARSDLGMARYETRSWVGWHHHMSFVPMAHLFITLTRRDLGKQRRSCR